MNFFKNRLVATCLLLVVIFGVTPVIAQGQLEDKVEKVQQSIYENDKGVCFRLSARSNAAGNLVAIAAGYPDVVTEMEALRFAQQEMASALDSPDPEDLYNANAALEPAFQALYQKLAGQNLSDNDRKDIESYQTTFNGAQRMLVKAAKEYNEEVKKFRTMVYGQHMFAQWFGIDMPKYYSADGDDYDAAPEAPLTETSLDIPEVPEVPEVPSLGNAMDGVGNVIDSVFDDVGDVMDGVGDILDEVLD